MRLCGYLMIFLFNDICIYNDIYIYIHNDICTYIYKHYYIYIYTPAKNNNFDWEHDDQPWIF